ncbi:MAG: SIMPL domain-containing protein [Cetobacterium sp.]
MKKIIASIFILGSSFTFGNESPTISVTGTGTISGKPDTFSLIATVETSNKESGVAIDENTKIIKDTINLLKKTGLKDNNLKTENYTLNYRVDYNNSNNSNNEMKYFARNQITITSSDLGKASTILTALNKGGVNNIGEINFYIADRKELEDMAYKLAYSDAKYKAALIANLENLKVRPKNIDLSFTSPRPLPFMLDSAFKGDTAPIPVTIPSNIEVTASLNATFYMEN